MLVIGYNRQMRDAKGHANAPCLFGLPICSLHVPLSPGAYALLDAWLALVAADSDAVAAGAVRWQWMPILVSGRTRLDGVTTLVKCGGCDCCGWVESSFAPSLLTTESIGWLSASTAYAASLYYRNHTCACPQDSPGLVGALEFLRDHRGAQIVLVHELALLARAVV